MRFCGIQQPQKVLLVLKYADLVSHNQSLVVTESKKAYHHVHGWMFIITNIFCYIGFLCSPSVCLLSKTGCCSPPGRARYSTKYRKHRWAAHTTHNLHIQILQRLLKLVVAIHQHIETAMLERPRLIC